jgi:hypothetical protein
VPASPAPPATAPSAGSLPAPRTSCTVGRGRPRPRIACAVALPDSARTVRVAVRLLRARIAHARADRRGAGRVVLRLLRATGGGRYTLVTVVSDGARSRQARLALTVPRR